MTSILDRILVGIIVALIAVGTLEWFLLRDAHKQLDAAEQSLAAAERENDALRRSIRSTNAALKARATAVAKANARAAAASRKLEDALQENPQWAGAAVPDAVWDSLFGPAEADPSR